MITSHEASQFIQKFTQENLYSEVESIPFGKTLFRKLAENISASNDQPPFNRVTMDGVAINYDSLIKNTSFPIEGVQGAGQETKKLSNISNCLEVMTGAPLPFGCDTVIPYEAVKLSASSACVLNPKNINCGQYIHVKGSDYKKNATLIPKNSIVNSGILSIIASNGRSTVNVFKSPKIAIISTGDELVEPGNQLLAHQIFRSNPFTLNALFEAHHLKVETMAHLNDNQESMLRDLKSILSQHQVIIVTGGVSKGKFDFLPAVLNELGVKTIFHQVSQRPGKPLFFGVGAENQLIFGLPGNPVSCVVSLRKYVIEALKNHSSSSMHVKIKSALQLKNDMTFFIPAKLEFSPDGEVLAFPMTGNGSGDFYSLRDSDGFIEVQNLQNKNKFESGTVLPFYHWNY